MSSLSAKGKALFFLDYFAFKQFDVSSFGSAKITNVSKEEFTQRVNELFVEKKMKLHDGYAPFCKHIFVENFTNLEDIALEITPGNKHLLESGYVARKEGELPVLSRWFPADKIPEREKAKYLDIILYSREQLIKEAQAMKTPEYENFYKNEVSEMDWGIISIKPQNIDFEIPMQPITMMRNALGKEEGGSGVALDREKYSESVKYWEKHALVS